MTNLSSNNPAASATGLKAWPFAAGATAVVCRYSFAWNVRLTTSCCCSLVSLTKFTA
jgi:hypothetical protein